MPVLDEAARLPGMVRRLREEADEVVVVDGGSADGSLAVAEAAGARGLRAPRGRGRQLHAGALAARGEVVWFVHADTRVPAGAGEALRAAAAREGWGCFATRVESADPRLRVCGAWMTARARRTGVCTGDMGMWLRREVYDDVGGFPPWAAFEDLELADRARARHRWAVVDLPLGTSARRWERDGVSRTILRMWALRAGFRLGVDPALLARAY